MFVAALVVLPVAVEPDGEGAHWADEGPGGHSRLVEALSQDHDVRVIGSSVGLLPRDAGEGDVLFLFPTHRPVRDAEVEHVREFVARGGSLVMAADGHNAAPLARALGVRFQGLPALLPPGAGSDCVPARVQFRSAGGSVCLPNPTVFPNLTRAAADGVRFASIAYSDIPVFLDVDGDGDLGLGDKGPVVAPLAMEWDVGSGRVIVIADADLWRNGVVDRMANLPLAESLASAAGGDVYVDSSGAQPGPGERLSNPWYRTLSTPDAGGALLVAVISAVVLTMVATAPRARALRRHDPPPDAEDPLVREAAAMLLAQAARPATPQQVTTQTANGRNPS